jgi:hypothetical protein
MAAGCATGPQYDPNSPPIIISVPAAARTAPLVPRLPLCARLSGIEELASARHVAGIPPARRADYRLGSLLVVRVPQLLQALFPATDACEGPIDIRMRYAAGDGMFTISVEVASPKGEPVATFASPPAYLPWPEAEKYPDTASVVRAVANELDRILAPLAGDLWRSEALRREADKAGVAWEWPESQAPSAMPPAGVAVIRCDQSGICSGDSATEQVGKALSERRVSVVPAELLLGAVWPWLAGAADADAATRAMTLPWFALRAFDAGVGSIVVIEDWGKSDDERGGIFCGGGYGGGGCLGLRWTDTTESARASVTRLATGNGPNEASITRTATTFVMPAFVLPIPIWIPQKTTLADELADRIRPLLGAPETK